MSDLDECTLYRPWRETADMQPYREEVDDDAPPVAATHIGAFLLPIVERAAWAVDLAGVTESPIETMFGMALARALDRLKNGEKFIRCAAREEAKYGPGYILLMPQFPWGQYRIDWAIKATSLAQPYLFIECDGAAFHTAPEQVARDKRRDATIQAAGIQICRFTGSEINGQPDACAAIIVMALSAAFPPEAP